MTKLGHGLRLLLAVLVTTVGLLAGAPASAQQTGPDCAEGSYVYVVYEGQAVVEGCGQAETAMGRLLELTTVQTAGQGFICQLAGHPDNCEGRPSGDQPYWSYWWWRDGEWVYATVGASYKGELGSIEAWHYAPGEPPQFVPAEAGAAASPAATPTPPDSSNQADDQGLPAWAPTAITAAVLGVATLGYLGWHRSRKAREPK